MLVQPDVKSKHARSTTGTHICMNATQVTYLRLVLLVRDSLCTNISIGRVRDVVHKHRKIMINAQAIKSLFFSERFQVAGIRHLARVSLQERRNLMYFSRKCYVSKINGSIAFTVSKLYHFLFSNILSLKPRPNPNKGDPANWMKLTSNHPSL